MGDGPISLEGQRVRRVERAFATLPDRYRGGPPGRRFRIEIRLGDVGRVWEVRVDGEHCRVCTTPSGDADLVIGTDASTWVALREGRMSGLDAFAQRRLYARGDMDLALGFEGMFNLPGGRPPLLEVTSVDTQAASISALVSGSGPEQVICLHGLGGTKTSFFETVAALTPKHTVHAIDLPGFGSSSKPARAPYDAPWFADAVSGYMDAMAIDRAHLIGNSMGGRIALELAMRTPERVKSLGMLAPAVAFHRRRELVPLVRLARPEIAAIPHPLRSALVRQQFWSLFARPERLDPTAADIAADEFLRSYRSRSARIAFYAAARNIYLDAPWGERGFWPRLTNLVPPALFIWGDRDRLVPSRLADNVAEVLPNAKQVVLEDCGHVPQVELPERTNALLDELIVSATPLAAEAPRRGLRRRVALS